MYLSYSMYAHIEIQIFCKRKVWKLLKGKMNQSVIFYKLKTSQHNFKFLPYFVLIEDLKIKPYPA